MAIRPIVLGLLLGLFSGIVPGPFSALIATSALRGGFWAGFRLAVVPLLSETFVLAVTALVVSRLPEDALQWVGLLGGAFIIYLAYRTWSGADEQAPGDPDEHEERGQIVQGAIVAVLSPAPWVFWMLIGAPLFLGSLNRGWGPAALFYGSFLLGLVGVHVTVAALAGLGQKRLSAAWRRRVLKGAAVVLVGAGGVLLWQSYVGNFQEMVAGSRTVQEVVEDSILER
jgi:threonine/homoserine/homoserine lactone efflux protein